MSRTPFYVIQTLTVIFQRSHGIYTTSKDKNIDKEIITLQHIHFENLYSSCERQSPQFIARSPGSPETMMWQPDFLGSLQKCNPIPPPNIPASTLTHMCFCLESVMFFGFTLEFIAHTEFRMERTSIKIR